MKKTLIALVACAALAATLAIAGCNPGGSGGSGNGGSGNDPAPTPSPTPSPDPAPVLSVTVSDLYRNTGIYKDPDGNEIVYAYVLPKVTGPDTDYIFDINMFVQKKNMEYVSPSVEAMTKGDYIGWSSVEYEAHAIGNMISMCMRWDGVWDKSMFGFETWLIRADGTKGENAELFAAKGVTEAQVVAKVREVLGVLVPEPDYAAIEKTNGKEMAQLAKEAYEKTFSDENINGHLGYYINDEGRLAVIVKEYSVAGARYYYRILDLGF